MRHTNSRPRAGIIELLRGGLPNATSALNATIADWT